MNNARILDEGQVAAEGDLLAGRWLVLRRGKRHLAAVEVGGPPPSSPRG